MLATDSTMVTKLEAGVFVSIAEQSFGTPQRQSYTKTIRPSHPNHLIHKRIDMIKYPCGFAAVNGVHCWIEGKCVVCGEVCGKS